MDRIVLHSRVGADGVLQLTVPLGVADADREVEVTIEAVTSNPPLSSSTEEWQQFVRETAGAWQGELERPSQGDYEHRDDWP